MTQWLPEPPCDLLDLGCGTGSLSLLAAEQGHRVTGVDFAPNMVDRARRKLAGYNAQFHLGNAASPPVAAASYDVVLARHVLWALPDPATALRTWVSLLRPRGRLVLVEGVWGEMSPVGIAASRVAGLLAGLVEDARQEELASDARLWGKDVRDERYVVVATVR
ncbi:class I SAM-dependent methyltransferase [Streptomyces sp. NPDC102406]|uniref:class I SAM-dependent methyltransferase n=1 Tax=Streptomyces sp. NPDC102406 TaxID=3366171 RepID=UPI0037F413BA